jgi:hypothetical protein
MVVHRDVSKKAAIERLMVAMGESQLMLLSEIFPRHVIEFLACGQSPSMPVS